MYPDYNAMVNEFVRPVVSLFLFVFLILGWVTAFMLMKENTILRIKLGKEDEKIKEDFKIWILRKTAPVLLLIYNHKNLLPGNQFNPAIKRLFKLKNLKLAFKISILTTIVSNVFGIDWNRTS